MIDYTHHSVIQLKRMERHLLRRIANRRAMCARHPEHTGWHARAKRQLLDAYVAYRNVRNALKGK